MAGELASIKPSNHVFFYQNFDYCISLCWCSFHGFSWYAGLAAHNVKFAIGCNHLLIWINTAYAVYFDHKRRSDPEFRKALRRESRREARTAKEEAEAQGMQQKRAIQAAVQAARDEGFPTDVEDKEAFFMSEVGRGEALSQDGVFDFPTPIRMIYHTLTLPKAQTKSRQHYAFTKLSRFILNLEN